MIKIAFFDVDGTLLKMGGKEPSKKTISTLKQLQKKGILLCMATGRSYPVIPNFEGIDFDVLLTFNGSYVRNKKEKASDNRQSTVSFKSKKKVRKPESEWFRVEDTHEPIIDKEVFYRVQEQIKSRRRQTKEKETPIFAGLVKCADCGWSMRFATNKANKTPYSYYACSYYGQFGKGTCSMHYIRYDVLYQAVLERLQYWAKAVQQDEEKVLNKIQKAGNAERIREKKKKASALKKAENRQNEIDRLFTKMYEDRACEKITERNFIMLSGKYQKEQIELEQQITNLREELSKMEQDMIGAEKWIELIKEYSVPKELTAPLLNAMIEKILIHEATTNEDNERIQEIEIYYRFIGKVD